MTSDPPTKELNLSILLSNLVENILQDCTHQILTNTLLLPQKITFGRIEGDLLQEKAALTYRGLLLANCQL
ncbi:hypothetical protein PAECIP111893_03974 [Paenibacillus plantiphilus]|uniref:Uncharacterized protein n=1 Tax=Paenibacillus plantiphilus TaxID=2905650 RepID=A0ABN8GQC5_9BACL|nr:hypothetical protein PAECIP111893_03974 [Paenibacillus plantiphilus]